MNIRIQNLTGEPFDERLWYHDKEGEIFPSIFISERGYLVSIDGQAMMVLLEHAEVIDNDSSV